jgi:hypothetical protein
MSIASRTRSRQRWLILISLGLIHAFTSLDSHLVRALRFTSFAAATFLVSVLPLPAATENPPKDGLLGFELHTPLIVEGYCPDAPRKDVYQTLIIQKVNGNMLKSPVRILIENVNPPPNLPANAPLVLKGYENAQDRKGVTIKDWKIVAVGYWAILFHLTEVISPDIQHQ